jgi:hypothetical protein
MPQNRLPDDDAVRAGLETRPFLAHLEDLPWTIIRCLDALVVGIIIRAFSARYSLRARYRLTGGRTRNGSRADSNKMTARIWSPLP